eukprot:353939-Chlamydomonas_euryale.AAC.7
MPTAGTLACNVCACILWTRRAPDNPRIQMTKRIAAIQGDTIWDDSDGRPLTIPQARGVDPCAVWAFRAADLVL